MPPVPWFVFGYLDSTSGIIKVDSRVSGVMQVSGVTEVALEDHVSIGVYLVTHPEEVITRISYRIIGILSTATSNLPA